MRLIKLLVLTLFLISLSLTTSVIRSDNNRSSILAPEDTNTKWEKLCEHLTSMIVNDDNSRNSETDVAIYFLQFRKPSFVYDGFYRAFQKYADQSIVVNVHDLKSVKIVNVRSDYMVLLLHEHVTDYEQFMTRFFPNIRADKSTKIIAVLNSRKAANSLASVWNALTRMKYFNVYIVYHLDSGYFDIFRTIFQTARQRGLNTNLQKVQHKKFLMSREILKGHELSDIQVVFFDSYPLTFTRNETIIGSDGNLIQEFSKKLQIPYRIVNQNTSFPSAATINNYLRSAGEINLYTKIQILSENVNPVWLNEIHGLCLLTPRNIPVSAYENFTFPLDTATIIAAIISTLSVIACWRAITNEMSMTSILFAVGELILNVGASGIERVTLRENILIYCFIFSSFIMASFYESIFLSFMLAESSMRSAKSIEELNGSNTMFYTFYDDFIAVHNNLPIIRKDLVMNYVHFNDLNSLNVPEHLDVNLVYMISCDYAEVFLTSSRNYQNGQHLYDKIVLTQHMKSYNVNKGFLYINEFTDFVQRMLESGIYKFWSQQDFDASSQGLKGGKIESQNRETIEFQDMGLPILILAVGCIVAFLVLLLECFTFYNKGCCTNHVRHLNIKIKEKRKLALDKWSQKYIYRKKLGKSWKSQTQHPLSSEHETAIPVNNRSEVIRCRECKSGGYFVLKKFNINPVKKNNPRIRHRIIQVQPRPEESTSQEV